MEISFNKKAGENFSHRMVANVTKLIREINNEFASYFTITAYNDIYKHKTFQVKAIQEKTCGQSTEKLAELVIYIALRNRYREKMEKKEYRNLPEYEPLHDIAIDGLNNIYPNWTMPIEVRHNRSKTVTKKSINEKLLTAIQEIPICPGNEHIVIF